MSSCITPLSWLVLERYQLKELPPAEYDAVASHLAKCDDCTVVLARIKDDEARDLPALPALPALPILPKNRPQTRAPTSAWFAKPRVVALAGGLALAAIVLFAIGRMPRSTIDDDPNRMKGSGSLDSIAFALVREDSALVPEAGGPYRDGERFKALVTCPPGLKVSFDLAVYEQGVALFPLLPQADIACGNAIPLAGAFRITGHEKLTVCLVWSGGNNGAIDREAVRRTAPEMLVTPSANTAMHAQCTNLDPTP